LDGSPVPRASDRGQQVAQGLGLQVEELYSSFDPFKRSSHRLTNKLTSSIQEAAQLQLHLLNNKPVINYNPIYNPIPIVNQNPYINKGRIDYVPQTHIRGKILAKEGGG
jgi:hypothetical protein